MAKKYAWVCAAVACSSISSCVCSIIAGDKRSRSVMGMIISSYTLVIRRPGFPQSTLVVMAIFHKLILFESNKQQQEYQQQ